MKLSHHPSEFLEQEASLVLEYEMVPPAVPVVPVAGPFAATTLTTETPTATPQPPSFPEYVDYLVDTKALSSPQNATNDNTSSKIDFDKLKGMIIPILLIALGGVLLMVLLYCITKYCVARTNYKKAQRESINSVRPPSPDSLAKSGEKPGFFSRAFSRKGSGGLEKSGSHVELGDVNLNPNASREDHGLRGSDGNLGGHFSASNTLRDASGASGAGSSQASVASKGFTSNPVEGLDITNSPYSVVPQSVGGTTTTVYPMTWDTDRGPPRSVAGHHKGTSAASTKPTGPAMQSSASASSKNYSHKFQGPNPSSSVGSGNGSGSGTKNQGQEKSSSRYWREIDLVDTAPFSSSDNKPTGTPRTQSLTLAQATAAAAATPIQQNASYSRSVKNLPSMVTGSAASVPPTPYLEYQHRIHKFGAGNPGNSGNFNGKGDLVKILGIDPAMTTKPVKSGEKDAAAAAGTGMSGFGNGTSTNANSTSNFNPNLNPTSEIKKDTNADAQAQGKETQTQQATLVHLHRQKPKKLEKTSRSASISTTNMSIAGKKNSRLSGGSSDLSGSEDDSGVSVHGKKKEGKDSHGGCCCDDDDQEEVKEGMVLEAGMESSRAETRSLGDKWT